MKRSLIQCAVVSLVLVVNQAVGVGNPASPGLAVAIADEFQYPETRALVQLVNDAADLIGTQGEKAFNDFKVPGSRWQTDEKYIFVLNPQGIMVVHPDATMAGQNQLDLKDINGKPIIRGLISAVTSQTNKPAGWYHYQWPVPGELLPRWKSTYVRLVTTPDGERYIVGSGVYNDRMEKSFVVDMVKNAVGQIEKNGDTAFASFHDPTGPFMAKDAYIFVVATNGVELVNPAFPNLEGRNIMDLKDTQGKGLVREMFKPVQASGAGWVEYLWPKPGESVSTLKSAYVTKAKLGDSWVLVGSGVYLADAPKAVVTTKKMSASQLMTLVREAAAVFEERGEKAYPEFRKPGSKWFHDDTYFFVWTMEGTRVFHAANPASEGVDMSEVKDVRGRPWGKMFLETVASPSGEGWIHYLYPEPGDIFPTWKSTFVKRVTFPAGQPRLIGCGIYNMQMDEAFIKDVVDRAAALVAQHGPAAFPQLRDKTGPYVFFDTYVFVDASDGTELVNPAQPSLEGKNLMDMTDVNGKLAVRDYIEAALKNGNAWVDYYWYKPGQNTPARKHTYVRKVQFGELTYIVGSGFYPEDEANQAGDIQKRSWSNIQMEQLSQSLARQAVFGQKGTLAQFTANRGAAIARHSHGAEEYSWVTAGALKFEFDDRSVEVRAGEVIVIPPNAPHTIVALEDTAFVDFFTPARADWLRGEDQYLRKSQAVDGARIQRKVAVMDVGFSPLVDEGMEAGKVQKISLNTIEVEKTIETKECHMDIKKAGSQPSQRGSFDWFTGTVRIDPLFEAEAPSPVQAINVTFEPGARTRWHSHPLGQHLIVTAGCGWVQRWDGPIEEIRPGDVVWIPSGEKHWHGATATTSMTHIAVYEQHDGSGVDWMEPVSDEQYRK